MKTIAICLALAATIAGGVATAHALTCTARCFNHVCYNYCR
jgi:hypothetical protein